jgi:hypothetical protein
VTIIGPDIWATLPPMPAFDPMPTVEELGNCKLVTAWHGLCEPRDPAFLRGTRGCGPSRTPLTMSTTTRKTDGTASIGAR